MTNSWPTHGLLWGAAALVAVAAIAAGLVLLIFGVQCEEDGLPISVDRVIDEMVVESEEEHIALQLVLSGDPEQSDRGRRILEDAALRGRPTAQRHLATYWALTDDENRRARVYQWLVIAMACARGVDLNVHSDAQINYLLFLSSLAQIEQTTSNREKDLGREWAKGWFQANNQAAGLASCDVAAIDTYHED
jgi:hypothetical protein